MPTSDKEKDVLRDNLRTKLRGESPASAPPQTLKVPETPAPPAAGGAGGAKSPGGVLRSEIHFGNPGLAQMTAFCRQLATLIEVGIPLIQSLNTLAERVEHPKLKTVVRDVARRVEEGTSFSDALAAHPQIFSSLVVNVARIGESGGILEGSLKYLAELMERRYEIRKRIKAALAYPIAALIVCGLALMVILGFAMPVFQKVYADIGQLPEITRIVLGLSAFVQRLWWLIILVVVAVVVVLRWLIRSSNEARRAWDWLVLKMPLAGRLAVQINVTRTCRTVANLLQAGIPLLETLSITAETSENLVVADMIKQTHDNLEKGGRLHEPLRQASLFPDLVVDMIAIGDEAGRLDVMFDKIAETYDSDVNFSIRTLNAILEPALIVVMGTIVAILALSVLLPYWQLSRVIE